ncbi:MAG: PAS domain-containing protein [Devosia sp.]
MDTQFSRLVDALPGMVWTMFSNGQFDYVNSSWCEYTGNTFDECRGTSFRAIVHPDDLDRMAHHWQAIVAFGEPLELQARMRRFDGEYHRFLLQIRPLADEAGMSTMWCGVGTDIEHSLQLEDDGEIPKAALHQLVNAIPTLVSLMTPEGALEFVNELSLEYFGASLEELKSWPAGGTVHPADLPLVIATWMDAVHTGEPYDIDHRIRNAAGIYRWFRVRGLPLRNQAGFITGWFVIETDIDDHKRNIILLAGENRLLEMLVSGYSFQQSLEALCQIVEDAFDECDAIVVLKDPSDRKLTLGAAPHLPSAFLNRVLDGPVTIDSGPIPMALELNIQVISADLCSETRWSAAGLSVLAVSHGLRAVWATPIRSPKETACGALAIYCRCPRSPTLQEQLLIQRLCNMASLNIDRHRSQIALKLALEEATLSGNRLRAMIDAVPGFMWCTEADGNVEFLNQHWREYTGQSLEESRGKAWIQKVHPQDVLPFITYWDGMLKMGEPGSFEARFQRFDGTYRWFLVRAVPVLDAAGRVLNWYGQNTDIDDRKRDEMLLEGEKILLGLIASGAALAQVLNAFCALVQTTLAGTLCSVVLVDPRQTQISTGEIRSPHLQLGAASDIPNGLLEEVDGGAVDTDASPVAMCAASGKAILSPDLTQESRWETWCSIALSHGIFANASIPIMDEHAVVIGVFSVLNREVRPIVTIGDRLVEQLVHLASIAIGRARRDAELKKSEAFLRHGEQVSRTGTFSWRMDTDEIVWSEEIYRIREVDPSVKPSFDLSVSRVHPEDAPSLFELLTRARTSPDDFEHQHRLIMADGSIKHLHIVARAIRHEGGWVEYIGALQDVTQRQQSDETLGKVRAELAHVARVASLGVVTASIAHEVNQPLAGIITNANTCLRMLAANPPNVEGARETARRSIRDGNRAAGVIKGLKSMFSSRNIVTDCIDFNEAAREVVAMLQGEMRNHKVTLQLRLAENVPSIHGDRVQLQQVILNLIMNAVDALSEVRGRVRHMHISTERDGIDELRFTVSDNGNGFKTEDANQLFEAFYTTKVSGMGIGLLVSRSIIERHGGRLRALANEAGGATFSFSIPRLGDNESKGSRTVFPLPRDEFDLCNTTEDES